MKPSRFLFISILNLLFNFSFSQDSLATKNSRLIVDDETTYSDYIENQTESKKISDYFDRFLTDFFDQTTEGIGSEELKTLLKNKESEYWKVTKETDSQITVDCKVPSSKIVLQLYVTSENEPILTVITQNEQANSFSTYVTAENSFVQDESLSPIFFLTDYYSSKKLKGGFNLPELIHVVFYYTKDNELFVDLIVDQEITQPDFRIRLIWNNSQFVKSKVPIS